MMRALLCLALLILPAALEAQTPTDSLRTELVRLRGFVRAAETQATKTLDLLDRARIRVDTVRVTDTIYVPVIGEPVPPPDTVRPPVTPPAPPADAAAWIIGPQVPMGASPWPWYDANFRARAVVHAATYQDPAFVDPADMYYYDFGLALKILAHRTGDSADAARAHAVVSKRWENMPAAVGWDAFAFATTPRSSALGSLILHAIEGHGAERLAFRHHDNTTVHLNLWEWLEGFVREHYGIWLGRYINGPALGYGVRDGGYVLLYAAQLAAVHPDSAVRADMRQMALTAARDYYARLQAPDGGWYWEDGSEPWEQPFMVGLLLEGMIATHQLTGDAAVGAAILRSVDHLWTVYDRTTVVPERPDLRWRAFPYFVFPDGRTQGETNLDAGWDLNTIREARQRSVLIVHAFGYAYHITGDPKYREQGDEIFAAAFGAHPGNLYDDPLMGQGPGADGLYSLADFRAREFNQAYRSTGRYLGWTR